VHRVRRRRADARLLVFFGTIEGPPLRAAVDGVFGDYEPAVVTDGFTVFVVGDDVAAAFGAPPVVDSVPRCRSLEGDRSVVLVKV